MARYSMEIRKLGKFPQFQSVILTGVYSEGLYPGNASTFTDQRLRVALGIQQGFLAVLTSNANYTDFLSGASVQFSNPELDTRYPAVGSLITQLNQTPVDESIFKTLKYYTVNGTDDLLSFGSVAFLLELGLPNTAPPYVILASIAGLSGSDLTVAAEFQTTYPSVGLLTKLSNSLLPAKQPITTDGIADERNQVLTTKSEFYKQEPYRTHFFVPQNHFEYFNVTGMVDLTNFWKSLVNKIVPQSVQKESKDKKHKKNVEPTDPLFNLLNLYPLFCRCF